VVNTSKTINEQKSIISTKRPESSKLVVNGDKIDILGIKSDKKYSGQIGETCGEKAIENLNLKNSKSINSDLRGFLTNREQTNIQEPKRKINNYVYLSNENKMYKKKNIINVDKTSKTAL
jgi:hypothetical protein